MLIRLLVVAALVLWLWIGTRNMKPVPTRGQAALEYMLGFVRNSIVFDTLGEKEGKRFLPILMTFFFLIIGMNLTGIFPGLQIASTAVIGLPLILAVVAYVTIRLRRFPSSRLRIPEERSSSRVSRGRCTSC